MKLDNKGIAHLPVIGLIVLVISVIGFTGYKIGQKQSNEQANAGNDTSEIKEFKPEQEKSDETVIVPEEKDVEVAPAEQVKPAPAPTKPSVKDTEKSKVYIDISLVSAVQEGAIVKVHSKIAQNVSGTCNFKLYREGFEKNHTSTKISNSQDCIGDLNVSSMPNYEGWSLHVWFDGDDGKTFAYQKEQAFPLKNPN